MNIDEIESGKGLSFLQTGHWTQDVVDKIKELNKEFFDEEISKGITVEYIEKAVRYAKDHRIKPVDGCYQIFVPLNNKHIRYGLSRWHYQQRRVRARREKNRKRIEMMKRLFPNGMTETIKRGKHNIKIVTYIDEKVLIDCQ